MRWDLGVGQPAPFTIGSQWFISPFVISMYPHPLFIQPQPKIFQMFSDIPNPQEYPGDCPKLWKSSGKTGAEEASALMSLSYDDISRPGISTKATMKTEVTWGWKEPEGGRGVQGVVMLQVRCKGCVSRLKWSYLSYLHHPPFIRIIMANIRVCLKI